MQCDYTSDRAYDVRRHVERKHPENTSTQFGVGAGKNEVEQGMEINDQLINTMRGLEEMDGNSISELDVAALETAIFSNWNAFKQKLEMGKEIKRIVEEKKVPKICLDKAQMQALKLHEEWICK